MNFLYFYPFLSMVGRFPPQRKIDKNSGISWSKTYLKNSILRKLSCVISQWIVSFNILILFQCLLQANNGNIRIEETDEEEVMWMKLVSKQLPHETMEEFRAPSLTADK